MFIIRPAGENCARTKENFIYRVHFQIGQGLRKLLNSRGGERVNPKSGEEEEGGGEARGQKTYILPKFVYN